MEKVAVIGGGQMGSQIAALSAMSGHETSIFDNNKEYLDSKLVFTRENIENLVSKNFFIVLNCDVELIPAEITFFGRSKVLFVNDKKVKSFISSK